jgi:hypothetical protein
MEVGEKDELFVGMKMLYQVGVEVGGKEIHN